MGDRFHLMPVITPSYPQQNSTVNVSMSTLTIMQEEFRNGLAITEAIMLGKCTWDKLFEAPNFFSKYRYVCFFYYDYKFKKFVLFFFRHFLVILTTSATVEDHLEWTGLVQSKIRHLISNLERNQHITLAHVNPDNYQRPVAVGEDDKNTPCTMWFIGLEFAKTENINVDLTYDIRNFQDLGKIVSF